MEVSRLNTEVLVESEDDRDSWSASLRSLVLVSILLLPPTLLQTLFVLRRFARHSPGDDVTSLPRLLTARLGDVVLPSAIALCNTEAQHSKRDATFQIATGCRPKLENVSIANLLPQNRQHRMKAGWTRVDGKPTGECLHSGAEARMYVYTHRWTDSPKT